jgi:phage shock protein C
MNTQRLYRSRTNKVFGGVCGGFAEYFDVDPVILRVLWVLLVIFGGTGILLYIAALIIIPKKPYENFDAINPDEQKESNNRMKNLFGYILVILGIIILMANLDVFHFFRYFDNAFEFIFPILLIILGMAIIYYRQSMDDKSSQTGTSSGASSTQSDFHQSARIDFHQFRRSSVDKKLFGVCGGLAKYFDLDPSMIRLLYVVLCFASFGVGLLLYVLLAIIVPDDRILNPQV